MNESTAEHQLNDVNLSERKKNVKLCKQHKANYFLFCPWKFCGYYLVIQGKFKMSARTFTLCETFESVLQVFRFRFRFRYRLRLRLRCFGSLIFWYVDNCYNHRTAQDWLFVFDCLSINDMIILDRFIHLLLKTFKPLSSISIHSEIHNHWPWIAGAMLLSILVPLLSPELRSICTRLRFYWSFLWLFYVNHDRQSLSLRQYLYLMCHKLLKESTSFCELKSFGALI
jgi:hypothetical protein